MIRRLAFALALAALPAAASAQQGAFRFDITAVGDSTISFRVSDAPWVIAGMKGIAVDQARHDALIARIQVIRVSGTLATAVVTGKNIAREHGLHGADRTAAEEMVPEFRGLDQWGGRDRAGSRTYSLTTNGACAYRLRGVPGTA